MDRARGRILIPLAVFGLLLAAKAGASLFVRSPWILSDETDYAAGAEGLWSRGRLVAEERGGQAYPPGYSLVLAPAYALGGMRVTYHAMLVVNALLTTLTGVAAFGLARRLLRGAASGTALAIGTAAALAPSTWLYSFVLMSENLYALLFTLSCCVVVRMSGRRGGAWALALGLLFGFMFVTRSITAGLAPAAVGACVAAGGGLRRAAGRVGLWAAGAATVVASWLIHLRATTSRTVTGYSESAYLARLGEIVSNWSDFLAYLRLVGHDAAGLAVLCGVVFMVFALDLVLRRSTWRKTGPRATALYVFLAAAVGLGLSALHQFGRHVRYERADYAVYSRYVDPFVPALVALGGVGLVQAWRAKPWAGSTLRLILIGAAVVALVAVLLPTGPYKTGNTLGLWHVLWFRMSASRVLGGGLGRVGPLVVLVVAALLTILGMVQSVREKGVGDHCHQGPRPLFPITRLILIAATLLGLVGLPTLREVLRAGQETAADLSLGRFLRDGAPRGSAVYVDESIYAGDAQAMHRETTLLRFWNPDKRVVARRWRVAAEQPAYLVSADEWPFPLVAERAGRWRLYRLARLGPLVGDPFFVDLTAPVATGLRGFHEPDADGARWTTGRASVALPPLVPSEDVELILGLGGGRPSTEPARIEVFFDGHSVAVREKKRGDLYPRLRVPGRLVDGRAEHRLDLSVNTFRPRDFPGWPADDRELGVQWYWVKVLPALPRPATRPAE